MTIDLPYESFRWPLFRMLTREVWADENGSDPTVSGATWTERPMQRRAPKTHGFYLVDMERGCLPMIGRARVAYRFGRFDDGIVAGNAIGSPWDSTVNAMNSLPNLAGHVIRIQAAERQAEPDTALVWTTVWLGYCDYQEDDGFPGAQVPMGERVYHCSELHARANRWPLDRHGHQVVASGGTVSLSDVRGAPGYNVGRSRDGRLAGNQGASAYTINGASVTYHTEAGAGTEWTDEEALEHALAATRGARDPLFTFSGETALLGGTNAWEIRPGETALDFLERVCRRERGKGAVNLSWSEASATGAVTVSLAVSPQLYSDKSYTDPVSEDVTTIEGALSAGTSLDVDLLGDHRLVESAFHLTSPDQWKYDSLETQGEYIQVLVTVAYEDGYDGSNGRGWAIERRWSSGEQTTFDGKATQLLRVEDRYRPVYQLHGLPRGWDCEAGDGNGANRHRVDYSCADDGSIDAPDIADAADTSPLLIDVMDSLNIFEGYDYRNAPIVRWDAATETGDPQRKGILAFLRISSDRFLFTEQTAKPAVPRIDRDGFWVAIPSDSGDGKRFISNTGSVSGASLGATYNLRQLALTVCLKLPHRVRLASYATGQTAATAQRRLVLPVPDMHLWLASPFAIWDLDTSTGSASLGHAPRYGAADGSAGSPGILRDDRSALARLHALASAWYLEDRRTAKWALRAFGMTASFTDRGGATIAYPTLGKTIHNLSANGLITTVNTPVVMIRYDNLSGTTSWETGWSSLDLE
jgi:hypothetical protein